jgi:hypothetical protein
MPISPQFEEVPSERLAPSASDSKFAQTSLLTGILLLESDLAALSNRARLLTNSSGQSGSYHFGNTSPWVLISRYFRIARYSSEMPIPSTDFVRAQHVHPDIPALQFVERRACELALGSESAWERPAFEMPQPGDPS